MKTPTEIPRPPSDAPGATWTLRRQYGPDDEPAVDPRAVRGDERTPPGLPVPATARGSRARAEGDASVERERAGTVDVADYAIGRVRDLFLLALDGTDRRRAVDIAQHLVGCGNPLPRATCEQLGIVPGSSYGVGARALIARYAGDD